MTPDSDPIGELRRRTEDLMLRDARWIGRRLQGLPKDPQKRESAIARLTADVVKAEAKVELRRAALPVVRYPPELPITERKDELADLIRSNQVVIVAGETGSGKSTQLPKICLELGRGVRGLIGHTQPRRIAARSVSERVAEELETAVGSTVGFAVRFSDNVTDRTLVKVMTDGILLAETRRDRMLEAYDTIIIDEAHERSLNIDFLLGYIKQLLPKRPDLKVIITSATIDTQKFSKHFSNAPIMEVSGRTYPVEVRYRPFGEEPDDPRDQIQAILDGIEELVQEGPGDILVFFSGEREIHDAADAIRKRQFRDVEVLPLYARLTASEQRKIFLPHQGRRIVLSTNVAETSLTVPGIRYVIDTGTARISRYSRRLKVQRLPIEPVAQASANQRSGRCGRVAPGICIRLFSEENFVDRPEFIEPEILRTNLASVILQAASLELGDIANFPFVDVPDKRSIKDGVALLEELGALAVEGEKGADLSHRLTPLGKRLSQLPIDPRLARMVLEAERHDCVRELLIIASALSIQDPRERPADKQQAADQSHARFRSEHSDFLSLVNLWEYLREKQREGSKGDFRRLCKTEYFNWLRVREWQDVNKQLREVAASMGIHARKEAADHDRVHQAVLSGLLSQIGVRTVSEREFLGARNAKFAIAPGSSLAKKPPRWVMAAELVETNRLWGRVAARIQPEWIEQAAGPLCKRTYTDPRWDPKRGNVVATERVTLFGLTIIPGRNVDYGRIDPARAREIFIYDALVRRDWETKHSFLAENQAMFDEVRKLEDRVRRRDILLGEEGMFEFYSSRIPANVTSARHFDRWWRDASKKQPALLRLQAQELIDASSGEVRLTDFPDVWRQNDRTFGMTYVFEPGAPRDGITVLVPVSQLNQVATHGFDWGIAGHRFEYVEALIRSLPKNTRRLLVPVGDHVRAFLDGHPENEFSMLDQLAEYLREVIRMSGLFADLGDLTADDFDLEKVPPYLRLTFLVHDDNGKVLAHSKNLDALKRKLAESVRETISRAVAKTEIAGLKSWGFGTIARSIEAEQGGHVLQGYPSLVDEGDSVALRVLATPEAQSRSMYLGTRKLLLLTIPTTAKGLERLVNNEARLAVARLQLGGISDFLEDCLAASFDELLRKHGGAVWDETAFAALRANVRNDLSSVASAAVRSGCAVMCLAATLSTRLDDIWKTSAAQAAAAGLEDVHAQLLWLVHKGFVSSSGVGRLDDVVRYLRGIEMRLDKMVLDPAKDRSKSLPIERLQREISDLTVTAPAAQRRELVGVRWLVEELRVSVFAQSLRTNVPVSEQRIRKELGRVTAG